MGHSSDKPKREKRKPKKDKLVPGKVSRGSDVIEHVGQHPQPEAQ